VEIPAFMHGGNLALNVVLEVLKLVRLVDLSEPPAFRRGVSDSSFP
jgi:hypothetical protein